MSQKQAIQVLRRMLMEGIEMSSEKATSWLRRNLKDVGSINPVSLINASGSESSVVNFLPGSIYLFGYNPKTKADLPYYDLYPMVLVISLTNNGFMGLNFHYIDHMSRQVFFNGLIEYVNDEQFDKNPNAYIDINYATLKATKKLSYYRPTIKRYYYKNIVSKVTEIPPVYWKFMLFLPLERFQEETKESVWKHSRKKI